MKKTCLLIVLFSYNLVFSQKKQSLLHLSYGNYNSGISQKKIVYSNSTELLVTIWQPVIFSKQSKPLTLRECFELDRLHKTGITDSLVNDIICGNNYHIQKATLSKFLNTKTNTSFNFSSTGKKFPVVIWSYRHGTEYYQFAMNEYLASHGFLVATVSRMEPVFKMPWEVTAEEKLTLLREYLSDMNEMVTEIKKNPQADTSSIALFSWSYGGDGAILFQQGTNDIDAVFGFSSVDFSNSFFLGDKLNTFLDSNKLNRPYYLFYEEKSRRGNQFSEQILHPKVRLKSSLTLFPRLWHGNFNYLEGYVAGQLNMPVVHPWSKPGKDAVTGYEAVCNLALLHLRQLFDKQNNGDPKQAIDIFKRNLPPGFIK